MAGVFINSNFFFPLSFFLSVFIQLRQVLLQHTGSLVFIVHAGSLVAPCKLLVVPCGI